MIGILVASHNHLAIEHVNSMARSFVAISKSVNEPIHVRLDFDARARSSSSGQPSFTISVPEELKRSTLHRIWQDVTGTYILASFTFPSMIAIVDIKGRKIIRAYPQSKLGSEPLFLDSSRTIVLNLEDEHGMIQGQTLSLTTGESLAAYQKFTIAFEDRDSGAVGLMRQSYLASSATRTVEWVGGKPSERGQSVARYLVQSVPPGQPPDFVRDLRTVFKSSRAPRIFMINERKVDSIVNGPLIFRCGLVNFGTFFYNLDGEGYSLSYVAERPDGKVVMRGLSGSIAGTPLDTPRQVFYLFDPVTGGVEMTRDDFGDLDKILLNF